MFGLIRPSHREQTGPSLACSMIISPEFTCRLLGFILPYIRLAFPPLLELCFSGDRFLGGTDCGLPCAGLIEMSCGVVALRWQEITQSAAFSSQQLGALNNSPGGGMKTPAALKSGVFWLQRRGLFTLFTPSPAPSQSEVGWLRGLEWLNSTLIELYHGNGWMCFKEQFKKTTVAWMYVMCGYMFIHVTSVFSRFYWQVFPSTFRKWLEICVMLFMSKLLLTHSMSNH